MLSRRQNQPFARTPRGSARAANRHSPQPQVPRSRAVRSKRSGLWYAIYFPELPDIAHSETSATSLAAQHCQNISDYISLDGDDALVLEVSRSLRYFGGLARIRQSIESGIASHLGHTQYFQAVTPSASASLLIARAGQEAAIGTPEDLRSRLGSIPTHTLAIDLRVRRKLAQCGLFNLRDIWRLPLTELRIRFGRHFSDYIENCLGLRPESRPRWQAKAEYHESFDADHGLHSVQQIISACEKLLHQLEAFLKKNHLCTDRLEFLFDYGHRGQATDSKSDQHDSITVNVRKAGRTARLFLLLLETQLAEKTFAGEVYSITLQVRHLAHFQPEGGYQQKQRTAADRHGSHLLDTLAAKLGSRGVQRFLLQQDYCPEFATRMVPYLTSVAEDDVGSSDSAYTTSHNPCWLLQPPRPLVIRHQQLHYLSPLTLLRGPRRIETRWWQDQGIRRDYYVAANAQGLLLWIYQDLARNSSTQPRQHDWYLHGFFG
ncbi:hypothetical protein [Pseudohongiella sp.]|uniref:UmuC domain-containing protein n=1 Tax=marine sediment metagenome TaxID=412755 RepID=A0A0F9Y9V2_9ZZZZ|nr:hypothetical protein [Pseudohongiella sp.]HDZ08779.1 hypothetical protein [Pseudohongiella sp.]HEA62395.1 hypothetical protein [Pseudohongiella sp.]